MKYGIWAGTEEAVATAVEALERYKAQYGAAADDTGEAFSGGLNKLGNTAFINVKGALVNADLPDAFASAFGITTYPSLQRQFAAALADEEVGRVVLDVDSGGGQVKGVAATVEYLKALAAAKPVAAYVGDMMASAAYWIGAQAHTVSASPTATVGSVGVIAVHISAKERLEGEGLKPTVLRAGSSKHLGHELEDLSEAARADLQRGLDFYHKAFMQSVADARGLPYAVVSGGVGDGRVFYGQEALEAGLVDSIQTFSQFSQAWQSGAVLPSTHHGGPTAAAASPETGAQTTNGDFSMNLEEALAKIAELEGGQEAGKAALAAAEARALAAETDKAQLEAANKALSAALAEADADKDSFAAVLKRNIETKAAALNTAVLMPETLADLQKMNAQLDEKFQAAFPAGGVAAVSAGAAAGAGADDRPSWAKNIVR
ncbi:S49 family peptidase [Neisseria leonii]|uniref:S49 family peptidase n=1 Tax=Neisseria leonii TaxID=2995413 RepID=A0A9X4E790_9NEIS|nr:S49 family peptidase [Neisseria sp. 51.81]MDD9326738.1 S49 family peptidase [Neisseria sp. 51.81]